VLSSSNDHIKQHLLEKMLLFLSAVLKLFPKWTEFIMYWKQKSSICQKGWLKIIQPSKSMLDFTLSLGSKVAFIRNGFPLNKISQYRHASVRVYSTRAQTKIKSIQGQDFDMEIYRNEINHTCCESLIVSLVIQRTQYYVLICTQY